MILTYQFYNDGTLYVHLEAQTPEDAARLVKLGLNRNAAAREVSSVWCGSTAVHADIDLHSRQDREIHQIG